ncbi:hypothetical protein [Halorientalis pallida]|uniref:Uncharacterized protein n=1 Tax=Halorientalis pallida TaxID=2479928 RepID=A0A498KTP8_9EURY|nr:hypothetical protein [Halorientalis pallida]RXK47485.1 hypothetical protein EAF64_17085 [Halorientalis pallida]
MGGDDPTAADELQAAVVADATARLADILNRYAYDELVQRLYWLSRGGAVAVIAAIWAYPVPGTSSSWLVGAVHLAAVGALVASYALERTLLAVEDTRSVDESTLRVLGRNPTARFGVNLLAIIERRSGTWAGRLAIRVLLGVARGSGYRSVGRNRGRGGLFGGRSAGAAFVGLVVTEQFLYTAEAEAFAMQLEGWFLTALTLIGGLLAALLVR